MHYPRTYPYAGYHYIPSVHRKTQKIDEQETNIGTLTYIRQKDLDKIVSFFNEETLNKIGRAEWLVFSVAYVGYTDSLRIIVPVAYYTIPTKIASASIEYQHEDIGIYGSSIQLENNAVAEFLYGYCDKVKKVIGCNSFHKHPSKSSFSGVSGDASKSVDEPGILFRTQEAKEVPIVDYVFYDDHEGSKFTLCDVNAKIVDVEKDEEFFAKGTYYYTPHITCVKKEHESSDAFGFVIRDSIWDEYQFLTKKVKTHKFDFVKEFLEDFKDVEYEVEFAIDENHFEVPVVTTYPFRTKPAQEKHTRKVITPTKTTIPKTNELDKEDNTLIPIVNSGLEQCDLCGTYVLEGYLDSNDHTFLCETCSIILGG